MTAAFRFSLIGLIACAAAPAMVMAQFGSSDAQSHAPETVSEGSVAGNPPATLAMEVWVVTLRKPRDINEEDRFGKVLDEVANLSADLGDRDDVQKLLHRWEELGAVRRLEHFRATSRSGQQVVVVPTERSPMVTGTTVTQLGTTNNIQFQQVGTSLKLRPRVVGEHAIDVDVEYENTELFDSESVNISEPKDGNPEPAVGTKGITVQSVVGVSNGHVMLATLASDSEQPSSKLVLVGAGLMDE